MIETTFQFLSILCLGGPALLMAVLGLPGLTGMQWNESFVTRMTKGIVVVGLLSLLGIAGLRAWIPDDQMLVFKLADWAVLPGASFHFRLEFIFDRLSIPFCLLAYLLCGLISGFAANYMHREPGYFRFFFLFAIFLSGMVVAILAGSIETLFFGWELVGLSSALLVAFFQDRAAPVRNGLRVWSVYRIADAAFLVAAATLHHLAGEGELYLLTGAGGWPNSTLTLGESEALFVGALLLVAAAGKSALVPFSGWLPRAMEGPTPSSAVFYGALSIHLGAYLLLRVSPILEIVPALSWAAVILGLLTALSAAIAGRVQSDVKSALAFASLTQVGLIVAEIGVGWRYVPLIHMIGHACLRTLQLLRAPTLLRDYQLLENAIGKHISNRGGWLERTIPGPVRERVYRFGLDRWYLDVFLDRLVVRPVQSAFHWCDLAERRWTDWLSGTQSRESDDVPPSAETREDL